MKSTDAFGHDVGMTKVKGYLVFILAFTAITNSVVSPLLIHFCDRCINQNSALLGLHCIFLLDLSRDNGTILFYLIWGGGF